MSATHDALTGNSYSELPDGIIELVLVGHQTRASSQEFQAQIGDIVDDRRKQHAKALILVDLTGVTGHDSNVRDAAHEMLDRDYDGLALFGENVTVRMLVNWLIRATGQNDRVCFFDTREDAIEWLKSR
jgi:hypothetical protein